MLSRSLENAAGRALLALLLLLTSSKLGLAQQVSPFQGQGVDPVTYRLWDVANRDPRVGPVPVYLSITLQKVLDVDEKLYRFDAVFLARLTWWDYRVRAAYQARWKTAWEEDHNKTSAIQACANATYDTEFQALCQASAKTDCKRPCSLNKVELCCDAIWLPAVILDNAVGYSQDRFVDEQIDLYFDGTVSWTVRIEGTFTNTFDFRKYPFDSQELKIKFQCLDPQACYLNSSYVGKEQPVLTSSNPNDKGKKDKSKRMVATDEVTGWNITAVNVSCDSSSPGAPDASGEQTSWQPHNPIDPLYTYNWYDLDAIPPASAPGSFGSAPSPQSPDTTCYFTISISRLSYYYAFMNIFPSVLLTIMAFAVFFTDPESIDVRMSTVVTLLLALVAVQFIITDQLPRTSYITHFLACVIASYIILFAILVENVIVYMIVQHSTFHRIRFGGKRKCCSESRDDENISLCGSHKEVNGDALADMGGSMETAEVEQGGEGPCKGLQGFVAKGEVIRSFTFNATAVPNTVPATGVSLDKEEGGGDRSTTLEIGEYAEGSTSMPGPKEPPPLGSSPLSLAAKGATFKSRASLAHEPGLARVVAWYVDIISGPLILLAYVTTVVVIFCI